MDSKLSINQLNVLKALQSPTDNWDHLPERGFGEIHGWFIENGVSISEAGLAKILNKLRKEGLIHKFLNEKGMLKYKLSKRGTNHVMKFFWPIVDSLTELDREKSLYFLFSHFGAEYHHAEDVSSQAGTSHESYYLLPLANEIHSHMLSTIAVKMISGEVDSILSKRDKSSKELNADIYLTIHYKLGELDKLSHTFLWLWENADLDLQELYDAVAGLFGTKTMWEKRDLFSSVATMLLSIYSWARSETHSKEIKSRAKLLDRKLGEIFLNRMDLLSDLDQDLIDIFIQDIENDVDPMKDLRVTSNKMITKHKYEGFKSYMIQDYIRAASIKRRNTGFIAKSNEYLKGTQGLLIRMIKYQLANPE